MLWCYTCLGCNEANLTRNGERSNEVEVVRRLFEHVLPSAADHELGAELHQAPAHRFAEPAAASGDQHALVPQKIWLEHVFPFAPCLSRSLWPDLSDFFNFGAAFQS
jgi:hypothetical protein